LAWSAHTLVQGVDAPCQEIIFVRVFARLDAINVVTHGMSQHDRNDIVSSLTFVLVRNEISSAV
jgi:hypothetical protein